MSEYNRAVLYGKLNPLCYKALENAATFAKLRGNPDIELAHWLAQMLQNPDSDLHRVIKAFEVNQGKLASDLTAALDRFRRGASAINDFSPDVDEITRDAWMYASLSFGSGTVRGGYLVYAGMKSRTIRNVLLGISKELDKVKPEVLAQNMEKVLAGSPEGAMASTSAAPGDTGATPGEASGAVAPPEMGKEEALKRFCVDLTEQARSGKIDPIVGRDEEIRQVVDVLMRRRQNNPILTGEAGVGKTAVVEGFAHRLVAGDVPPQLRDNRLLVLDIGLLQAGASMKGEFEQRLRSVIEEVQRSPKPIIMFIDEAHTLVGAGGAAGQGDAANLLKPALARGTFRTIAATTWAEYKKYIEKDPALTRRFQVIKVDEPTEDKCVLMIRNLAGTLEKHHRVQVLDEAIDSAVRLSHRYIPSRQLPDKAVSLLDTASARVAISQHAVPAEVDDCRRRIQALETELEIIDREMTLGAEHESRRGGIAKSLGAERTRLAELETHWTQERELVARILDVRSKLRAGSTAPIDAGKQAGAASGAGAPGTTTAAAAPATPPTTPPVPPLSDKERASLMDELKELQGKLRTLQGEDPLILPSVDAQAVASVVADWTGIPVGRMVKNEIESVLRLADTLEKRVIGQRHALETIAKRIQTSRAGLDNPTRPVGVFMLVGPSGVGKTETALTLAEAMYGGEQNLITINMSEFQEAHTVSTLKGAPPGYVGYGEGGVLTEAVRRRPYSVVLLDEVEKAHPDVHEIFFQVFDKGIMEDGEGREINFKNTVILLTSNCGSDLIMKLCKDPATMPDVEGIQKALREPLLKTFPAALLGRLVTVPYYPINADMLHAIIRHQLGRIQKRLMTGQGIPLTYDDEVVKLVASRSTEAESGARAVDAILTHTVLPTISREYLTRLMQGQSVRKVHLGVKDKDFVFGIE